MQAEKRFSLECYLGLPGKIPRQGIDIRSIGSYFCTINHNHIPECLRYSLLVPRRPISMHLAKAFGKHTLAAPTRHGIHLPTALIPSSSYWLLIRVAFRSCSPFAMGEWLNPPSPFTGDRPSIWHQTWQPRQPRAFMCNAVVTLI